MTTIQFLAEWAFRSSILILRCAVALGAASEGLLHSPAGVDGNAVGLSGDSGAHRGVAEGAAYVGASGPRAG